MAGSEYNVCRATLIDTEREARRYYQDRFAGRGGMRSISCYGRRVIVYFATGNNHAYTAALPVPLPLGTAVVRREISPGRFEERVFSLDRARLMDEIERAIQ